MLMILLAGCITGLLISAPIGPMAALASLEVSRNRMSAALAVAGGVCAGDVVWAVVVLCLLQFPLQSGVPEWASLGVGALVLAAFAAVIWKEADKPVRPAVSLSFIRAVIATLLHPGNAVGYLALYAASLLMVANRAVENLTLGESAALVMATCVGMVMGWILVLGAVKLAVLRFGEIPSHLQPAMARVVSGIMALAALGVVIQMIGRM